MEEQHALENLLLSAMIGLILVPSLIIVTTGARSMQDSAEQLVRGELQLTASSFAESMTGWLDENFQNLRSLAHVAGVHHQKIGDFSAMGPEIDIIKHADTDFLALALFRPDGNAVHIRPNVEPPQEGQAALMTVREEIIGGADIGLSSSFRMQAVGRTTRAVVLAAPVKGSGGNLIAIAAGILDASSVHSQLENTRGQRDINVAIHDGSGHLFSSSDAAKHRSALGAAGTAPSKARKSGSVEVQHYGSTLTRVGVALDSMAYAVDLDGGYYRMRMPLEGYPGWEVAVTRYLDDTLEEVVRRNIGALLLTFAVVLVVGSFALVFSRTIVSSISALKVASAEASQKITDNATVPWPRSHIKEVSSLSENFQVMSRELRESFARLEEARDKAEEASLAKSRFLQNVSHELRTPLNGILGFAQILERDDQFPEEYRDAVHGILESGNDLLRFIKDLLVHAKIDSQHIRLEPEPVAIRDVVSHVVSTVRPSAEAKRLEFRADIHEDLPVIIHVDDKRLRQILYNLLSNAVAYTDSGSIHLRAFPESSERVVFSVEDTGPGIPEDEIDAIFSPLRQLERHPQSRGGTGLGLSIVKRLVAMMGGRIEVQSTVGVGSTFEVSIPIFPQ
jgi:signal transduction histidine kinase